MSDQLNSSNEEGSVRRGEWQRMTIKFQLKLFDFPPLSVTRSRGGPDPPLPLTEGRKTRQSVDKEVLSQPAVTMSPRRPLRGRRLSTDDHEDTPPAVRALRNRRISVDRESATGTPKMSEEGSESGEHLSIDR